MAEAAAAPITPLSGAKKFPIEILTRAAGAAVKIGTGGIISEGDVRTVIESLVDYIRRSERRAPRQDHTVVGRALSNLFHRRFFTKMAEEIKLAKEKYEKEPSEANEKNLEDTMNKFKEFIEAANKPPISFREKCSRAVNWMRPMFGRQKKWDAKAEVERGMCEEEDASVVAAREEQEGIISKVLEENPFDQFGPDAAPAVNSQHAANNHAQASRNPFNENQNAANNHTQASHNPFNSFVGGKRRNKSRKARARKARKGLKSRRA